MSFYNIYTNQEILSYSISNIFLLYVTNKVT